MPGVRGVRGRRHVKRYHYDFHIHSCLSPCGDDEMTPADIVGMACVNGLDIIALTDHNCARNTPAAVRAGERAGLTVIPGMELETAEEVHVVLLFPTAEAALACGQVVDDARFKIGNRPDIYGRQVIMDESDNECGELADLLVTSTSIGVYEAAALAGRFGGVAYPAHADKPANGILQILGALDRDMGFTAVEASPRADAAFIRRLAADGYAVMYGSDAHYLADIGEPNDRNGIELDAPTPQAVIRYLRQQTF